jgi:hypothetical protein
MTRQAAALSTPGSNDTVHTRRDARRAFLRTAALGTGAAALGLAMPAVVRANHIDDIYLLNYALTLEHLEYAFYRDGLVALSRGDIQSAQMLRGLGGAVVSGVYDLLRSIRDHEYEHVVTLDAVIKSLGGTPVQECQYAFGYKNADGFLQVARALENTGVMAYTGALALIQNADLQTAGATIATVEARHASYLNLLNGASPFPAAFDTPKSIDEILAIAGPFIVSCG